MCGEKGFCKAEREHQQGSPPRVRGKEKRLRQESPCLRITPACAGKSDGTGKRFIPSEDHPRVCGEKEYEQLQENHRKGSPPRVRGKAWGSKSEIAYTGITPACAGKSVSSSNSLSVMRDHPRVCGEKSVCVQLDFISSGSPPRVRGKDLCFAQALHPHRITPACAGKRLKKAHKIKDFDPVPIRFHLVFRRFERWCSNLPTPDGNVPV